MTKYCKIDTESLTIIAILPRHPRADVDNDKVDGLKPNEKIVAVERLDPPTYDPLLFRARSKERVLPTAVLVEWELTRRPPEEIINQIKATAGDLIVSKVPEWKQRNVLAQFAFGEPNARDRKKIGIVWRWIDSVRSESDDKEAAVLAGESVDINDWPEYPDSD